jgi:hypothetical protein
VFNLYGVNSPQLAAMGVGGTARVRHSRMLLAGIQANFGLDPRLRHSGVTTWGKVSEVFLIPRSLPRGDSFSPIFLPATLNKNIFFHEALTKFGFKPSWQPVIFKVCRISKLTRPFR